jgi:hypothetical protein
MVSACALAEFWSVFFFMALRASNLGVEDGQDQRFVPKESRILERPRSCLILPEDGPEFLLTRGVASNAPPVHREWFMDVGGAASAP